MMKRLQHPLLILSIFVAIGCASESDGESQPHDDDIPPVVEGDWYRPTPDTRWQWQLAGEINAEYDVEVYDIDLFETPEEEILALKRGGKKVICYFSAGSSEDWRPDFNRLDEADMGQPLDGWEGERWVDIRSQNVRSILLARLELAKEKGCVGVEPDNVDGYDNNTGFDFTAADQLEFNQWTADEAHRRGLAVGLKNDGPQAEALADYYDFALNEECHQYAECEDYKAFLSRGKPVFNAEYPSSPETAEALADEICPTAREGNIRTLILPLDLDDAFRISCDEY